MIKAVSQTSLFPISLIDEHFERSAKSHGFEIAEVDIGDITFQGGQSESVHRWFRLTPSYSPTLVRFFIEELEVSGSSLVLDPFAGRGTTTIECQKQGISSIAFELNPILQMVGNSSLKWCPLSSRLFDDYILQLGNQLRRFKSRSLEKVATDLNVRIPDIHDVYRWWRPTVLRDLLVARHLVAQKPFKAIRHYLRTALAQACLDCANIHRNHPTITFHDDHARDIDVLADLTENLIHIQEDLAGLSMQQSDASRTCRVELRNSCECLSISSMTRRKATHVITSPPYPNRFSYVHQTRPQLHFMELIASRVEATEIDLETVGGTWGSSDLESTKRIDYTTGALKADLGLLGSSESTKYLDVQLCDEILYGS